MKEGGGGVKWTMMGRAVSKGAAQGEQKRLRGRRWKEQSLKNIGIWVQDGDGRRWK